jgi:hypothetical protein
VVTYDCNPVEHLMPCSRYFQETCLYNKHVGGGYVSGSKGHVQRVSSVLVSWEQVTRMEFTIPRRLEGIL